MAEPKVLRVPDLRRKGLSISTTKTQVYVGRPSKWGNLFIIGLDGSRDQVVKKYEEWIKSYPPLLAQLDELRGKDLICWCAPLSCHADVLLRLANE